jgi:peptidyl-dipeptidase A
MRIQSCGRVLAVLAVLGSSMRAVAQAPPTAEEAKSFVDDAERRLLKLGVDAGRAAWVQSNFITEDTEILAAQANERVITAGVEYAKKAARFKDVELPADLARKIRLLRNGLTLAAPSDPKESEEVTRLAATLEGTFGRGKYCPPGSEKCLTIDDLTKIMAGSRDPKELLDAWKGWHSVSVPMRKDYARYVELANKGARELGFSDTGAMWREKYDMPEADFEKEMDRLWLQMKPFYVAMHAYVRARLREKYGASMVPEKGPIPAHLLGNLWAQEWGNIYPLVAPKDADPGYDLTDVLRSRKTDARQMVRFGEGFFTSLGFDPLPATFWERSLFTRPRDRDVVCHASAWDIDAENDLRIKMCIGITGEDFRTIHHELGHNFYQRAYNRQPPIFRDSANDGFHEAIGDTIALSITPDYLVKLGFIGREPDPSKDTGLLMKMALDKIMFLPFALMVDKWRWEVFAGKIKPEKYNEEWWRLAREYRGIVPPVERSESDFDPGAKFHVAANVPYARYFLADILQFQFHRALAREAGCGGPLNRCSIYGNKKAGAKLNAMLEMGLSRPWPDAMEKLTGERRMDATAILDYFAPLKKWLDEQNKGKPVGW